MDAAIWKLAGPISYFAIGALIAWVAFVAGLVAFRRRISRNQFRAAMKGGTFVFLIAACYFFLIWLPKHVTP